MPRETRRDGRFLSHARVARPQRPDRVAVGRAAVASQCGFLYLVLKDSNAVYYDDRFIIRLSGALAKLLNRPKYTFDTGFRVVGKTFIYDFP